VLRVEEAQQPFEHGPVAVVGLAEALPGLLLEVGELQHQQLVLRANVAIDRAGSHPGALGDGPQRGAVEAPLAAEIAEGLSDAGAAAAAAREAAVVRAQRRTRSLDG
jgi:hypothetical protein